MALAPDFKRDDAPPASNEPTMEIFKDFDIFNETYVTRQTSPILAHIIVPKNISHGSSHPVIVNWHGGFLVTGDGLFPPFFNTYLLDAAKKHSAIIVSPDYTLLPHKQGLTAVQDDIKAFHEWLTTSFQGALAKQAGSGVHADLSRVLLNGGSAGGYAAMSHALAYPNFARSLALAYPMIDFDTEWWRKGSRAVGAPNPFEFPDSMFLSDEDLKAQVEKLREGPVVSAGGDDRASVAWSAARAGLFPEVFDPSGELEHDSTVWLNRRVEQHAALPQRIWVLHGTKDTGVPVDTSKTFAETMKRQGRPVRLDLVEGQEHGCDSSEAIVTPEWKGAEDPVISSAMAWLEETWLQ